MSIHFPTEAFRFPQPSTAKRRISHGTASCAGHIVVETTDGLEIVIGSESHEELICYTCIAVDPSTFSMHEQVPFVWTDETGKKRKHWFDLIVERNDEVVIAYSVKPKGRATDDFLDELQVIGSQAVSDGLVKDVRVLNAQDFDETTIWNAKFLLATRRPDPAADEAARAVVRDLSGTATLDDLIDRTGFEGRGFHALLRLIRAGHLGVLDSARLDRNAIVFLKEILQ